MTSQQQTDALLRAAVRAARVGLWSWDISHNTVTYSAEWKEMLGYGEEEVSDAFHEWEHRVHPDDLPRLQQTLADYLARPWPDYRVEFRLRHKDGSWRWILTQADVVRDPDGKVTRMIGSQIDITEQKRAEAERVRVNRALRMLSDSNQALIRATDENRLLHEVCHIAVEMGGYRLAWIGFAEQDAARTLRPVAHAGEDQGYLAAAEVSWAEGPSASGPAATAIRTRRYCVVRDIQQSSDYGPRKAAAQERGFQSVIALPLEAGGEAEPLGVLKIYSTDTAAFDEEEIAILTELAGDVAYGIAALRGRERRARGEAEIRRLQAELDLALDAARLGNWSWDIVSGKVTWSARCKALYGLPPDTDVTYERFLETVHPDDRAATDAALKRAVETRSDYEIEKRVIWPDGSLHWNLARGRVFPGPDGQPALMTGVTLDITERRQAEEALRAGERRLRSLMDNFPDYVFRFDAQGRFVYLSPSISRAVVLPPDEILGRTPLEVQLPDSLTGITALHDSVARVLATGLPERLEATFRILPGPHPFEIRLMPERDDAEGVCGVLGIAIDLTERKSAERQLYLLNHALDSVGESIFLLEGDSPRFRYVNRSAAETLGYSREELTGGMGVFDIDPEWDAERWGAFLPEIKARRRLTIETTHRTRTGRIIPVEVTGNYFTFEGQAYDMAIVRDISERKAAERAVRESETMYRSLVTSMAEGVVFQAADGRITAVNPMAEQIQGRTMAEMIGKTSDAPDWGAIREDGSPFPGPEHPAMVTLRTGAALTDVVMGIHRPDGRLVWISINSQPLVAPGETRPYAVVTTFHDITDRRRTEASLKAREREYRSLAENTPDLLVRWDRELKRVYVNPAFAQSVGQPAEALLGAGFGERYAVAPPPFIESALAQVAVAIHGVFATGQGTTLELPLATVQGARAIHLSLVPEHAADGGITTVLGIGRDITALKESERQFRALTEHSPDIILRFDREGRYLYANSSLERLTGVPAREHIGRRLGEVTGTGPHGAPSEVYRALRERITRVWTTRAAFETVLHLPQADGEHIFNVRLIPEWDDEGAVSSVLTLVRDITERERAEEALRASEQRFRQVTENIDEVFWLTDAAKTEMIYISPAYERVFGQRCEQLYADAGAWMAQVHAEDLGRVQDAVALQVIGGYDIEYRILRDNGVRWIHDRAFPIRDAEGRVYRIAGVAEDVTVRRELEERLRQSQKMDAVGQLAGGIAHDFNNMLAVIQMQSTLLLEDVADAPDTREGLLEILAATERATNLTRQLLTFSRRQVTQPVDLDISETVGNLTRLLRRVLGEHIALETHLAHSPPLIHADPGMMEQVLLNLAINARDAMPDGGRLSVSLEVASVSDQRAALHPGATAGRFIILSVTDTGWGIPAQDLPRIFEPFFTTKAVGKGTGLGLATVFGIVQQHHGWIEVESTVGSGTTFRVFLPTITRAAARSSRSTPVPQVSGGTETVLLVEDEPSVRALTRTALERYGYRVLSADSAAEAIRIWEASEGIDLLLTDLIMPGGMSGRELAEVLGTGHPELRIVYTTGYSPDVVGRMLRLDPGRRLLQKPFAPTELAAAIRQALDERPRGTEPGGER